MPKKKTKAKDPTKEKNAVTNEDLPTGKSESTPENEPPVEEQPPVDSYADEADGQAASGDYPDEFDPDTFDPDGEMFDGDLAGLEDNYQKAEEKASFSTPPPGKYQVKVEKVTLVTTKTTKKPMLKWMFKIISGNYKGQTLFDNMVLTPKTLDAGFIKGALKMCGWQHGIVELKTHLDELLDVCLEVSTTSAKDPNYPDSYNLYFNKRLKFDAVDDDEGAGADAGTNDDDDTI